MFWLKHSVLTGTIMSEFHHLWTVYHLLVSLFYCLSLCEKCPDTSIFMVLIFLYSDWIYLRSTSPYWVRMQENTDQKNLRIWTFFTQYILLIYLFTSSTLKHLSENTFGSSKELLVRKILGSFSYFFIAYSTWLISSMILVSKLSTFPIFNSLTTLLKNSLKVSITYEPSLNSTLLRKDILELAE